jgi:protein-disulfide isomerase
MSRNLRSTLLTLAALISIMLTGTASAQSFTPQQRDEIIAIMRDAMKRDPSILRDAVVSLQADDARRQGDATAATLAELGPQLVANPADPVTGNVHGKLTLVEFYDVRCPYCRRMLPTLAALLKANPDLRLVYKDLPVLGPGSVLGARALLASQKQGGYQKLHDAIMAGPAEVTEDSLHSMATRQGLDWARLQSDMKAPDVQTRINANLAMAHKLDLQGTPAYVVGSTLMPGAVDLSDLQDAVNAARKQMGG